jgi:hypothetical protein
MHTGSQLRPGLMRKTITYSNRVLFQRLRHNKVLTSLLPTRDPTIGGCTVRVNHEFLKERLRKTKGWRVALFSLAQAIL